MRSRELDAAIVSLRRLLASKGSGSVHDQRLRQVLRELNALRKGGKVDQRRVIRVVGLVSQVICDEFLTREEPDER